MNNSWRKWFLFFICSICVCRSIGQPTKTYVAYINPISICFRNPTAGVEVFLKNTLVNSIFLEGSYMFKDNKLGGFLSKGFTNEQSKLTPFESYPINKYPVYVYNGFTYRVGISKYFKPSKIHQYISLSAILKKLHYDSLTVNYNNNKSEKRTSFYDNIEYTTHYRTQHERLNSIGLGTDYGIKKVYENVMLDFYVRINLLYTQRNITSYNEQFNTFYGNALIGNSTDVSIHHNSYNIIQFRPQIGLRIGLTNF